jgi:hypothetical protein
MSDEYTVEERLEGARRGLLKNSIFFCAGWLVLWIGMGMGGGGISMIKTQQFFCFLGWLIMGGPRIVKAIFAGFGAALKPDYEVVTTYGNGRTESDGGAQSMQINFLGRIIAAGAMFAIGGLITMIAQLILTFKYIGLHLKTKPKPVFVKSGMLIIVINIAVFFGSIAVYFVVDAITSVAHAAAYNAEHGTKKSGDFETELSRTGNGRTIHRYEGKGGSVIIPDEIDGLPVVQIDNYAFSGGKKKITQITLPKTLKIIDSFAFKNSGITSIVIPEGVTDIGAGAFQDCAQLTSVTLPQSLQRVGYRVFEDCTSLTEVKIPSGHTIKYGIYSVNGEEFIEALEKYFSEDAEYNTSSNLQKKNFKGCTKLSAASRQAIRDSGYIGEF